MAILQVIPVEAPVVDVSLLPVELELVAARVDVVVLIFSAPVEVLVNAVVVAVLEAVEDDASELCTVVADVTAAEAMAGEVGSAVEVPADVVAPENRQSEFTVLQKQRNPEFFFFQKNTFNKPIITQLQEHLLLLLRPL